MELGDKVLTKKIGVPSSGIIIALFCNGEEYAIARGAPFSRFIRWFNLYPSWIEKEVAIIKYDSPLKLMSKDELKEICMEVLGRIPSQEALDMKYLEVPISRYAPHPIDDLESFE